MRDGGPAPWATLRELTESLARHGTRTAVSEVHGDRLTTITFADLAERSLRLASGLAAAGITPGTPVLLFGPNSIAWIVVRLALASLGALTVALDDLLTDEELATLVPDSGAACAFVASKHLPRLPAAWQDAGRPVFRLDDGGGEPALAVPQWTTLLAAAPGPLPPIDPDAPHMLVYTSGTTGHPKSFLLNHSNSLHNVVGLTSQDVVGPDDRILLPLPFHHVYPLTVGILSCLASGAALVLPEAVDGPRLATAMRLGRITAIIAVPRLYGALLSGIESRAAARGWLAKRAFKTLFAFSLMARRRFGWRLGRRLFATVHRQLAPDLWLLASGGARFEAELIWKLEAMGWDVRSGWGLAETASILTNNGKGAGKRIGSEGRPLPGMEVRVADADAQGVGELQARGPSVFRGYQGGDPQVNAATFTADGWFRTGDLGRIDADGFVHVAGRVKEMIVLGGGKNVFPEEVEKVYAASPVIKEIAVLEQDGALAALVVPDVAAIRETGTLQAADAVRVALMERSHELAPFQRISGYAITGDTLPRNRLGKYQRFLLPDLYRRAKAGLPTARRRELSDTDRALLDQPLARELWSFLKQRYDRDDLHPDLSLQLDLAIDSLEWVTLSLEMAERFQVHLSEEDAATLFTLRDLVERVLQRAGSATAVPPAQARPAGALAPLSDEQARWLRPLTALHQPVRMLIYALNQFLIRGLFGLSITGLQRVPMRGPAIIACNHVSDIDAFIVVASLGRPRLRYTWWSGDAGRLFANGVMRLFSRASQIFPVDERAAGAALASGAEILRRGNILVWFPESWRSPDGELQRFLPGVGHLMLHTRAPVIPARVTGAYEAWPRNRHWPRLSRLGIAFGPPVDTEALIAGGIADAASLADRVRDAVGALPSQRP
ncbi:MAG: AMP-binding protein [Rhodospirillaceae bacterium]|nr:AMP-binding protein [Rhodospirillaceae bacterium]